MLTGNKKLLTTLVAGYLIFTAPMSLSEKAAVEHEVETLNKGNPISCGVVGQGITW